MHKKIGTVFAVLGVLASLGIGQSYAATKSVNISNTTHVFVAKDVTQSLHYEITYRAYSQTGQLLNEKTLPGAPGSLIAVHVESLAQAEKNHQQYVIQQGDHLQQEKEINTLHQMIQKKALQQSTATIQSSPSFQSTPNVSYLTADGSFNTYHNAYADYQITYSNNTYNGTVNVSHYQVWLSQIPSSAIYWNWINWAGNGYTAGCPNIGAGQQNADSYSMNWSGGSGQNFTTDVNDCSSCNYFCGTDYQGYVALN